MIILASGSPRRRELLDQIGMAHQALPVDVDETPWPGEAPDAFVRRITLDKARAGHRQQPDRAILAADTCVVLDGQPLGKPRDEEHAVAMLLDLAGRGHEVLTGVALIADGREAYRLSRNQVRFRAIAEAEARRYWATGEPADKAGGYAVQGRGALFIEHIAGSYSGIMGLPLFETGQLLAEAGLLRV
ncbi:Maf family protein [Thiolapillus sp.]